MRAGGQRQRPGGGLDSAVRGGGQADSGNVTRKWNRYQLVILHRTVLQNMQHMHPRTEFELICLFTVFMQFSNNCSN